MNYTTKALWRNNTTDSRHTASRCVQRLCPFAAGSPRFASARGPGRAARSPYHPTTRRVLVFTSEQFLPYMLPARIMADPSGGTRTISSTTCTCPQRARQVLSITKQDVDINKAPKRKL
jgi:hypothetical protein